MTNKSPDNNFHWREKLQGLEHLSGEVFNKEAAWHALYSRLRGKRGNKKFLWYWAAAGCLLFILIAALLDRHRSRPETSKTLTIIKDPKETIIQAPDTQEQKKIKIKNTDSPPKDKIATVTGKSKQAKNKMTATAEFSRIRSNESAFTLETKPLITPLQQLDHTSFIVALPEKKKLKVVHINELGDRTGEENMVRNNDTHAFKLKFAKGEVFVNSSVASRMRFTILKNKTALKLN